MTEESILESTVMTFIKNRSEQNESTASRHIHRRFDIPMDTADRILAKLAEKKMIVEFYDTEYQESRYSIKI